MINMTPAAIKAVQRFIRGSETPVIGLRLTISGGGCSGLQYGMKLENEKAEDDWELEVEGVKVLVDAMTFPMIDNVTVDFVDTLTHTGFKFGNRQRPGPADDQIGIGIGRRHVRNEGHALGMHVQV